MAKQPMNPLAGAAGPGPFATRTDNLTFKSDTYGAGVENAANLAGAPLAKTPDVRGARASDVRAAASNPVQVGTRMYDASIRPDEDIMTGSPVGPGAGPEVLGMNQASVDTDADRQRMLSYLPALEALAQSPASSQSFRNYVRLLRANLL
jgi:hypothetical protein